MHHRQHRFVHRLFDGGPLDVNGHFRRTKAAAKYHQPKGKHQRRGEPQRHAQTEHSHHGAAHGGANHRARAKALHQPGRAEDAAHRANRQAKQHDPHLRRRDGQRIADCRGARCPGSHQQPGDEEEHKQRPHAQMQGFARRS